MAQYLAAGRIIGIHEQLAEVFAELEDPISPPGVRNENLVHSAAARPQTGLGKTEKYPTIVAKGAALFHSLVTNHPFHNGNKRTALISLVTFLAENHRHLTVSDDEVFDFVTAAAQGYVPGFQQPSNVDVFVAQLTKWIDDRSEHLQATARTMRTDEFIDHAERAGAKIKVSHGGWVVIGTNMKSIRINRSTRQISGIVARVYLNRLGMSEAQSGLTFEQFQAGLNPEQEFIQTLMSVLRRLAHA